MANGIPINGEPEGKVFGIVGEVALSDLGNAYVKKSNDTLNIGWNKFLEPNIFEFEEISLTSVTQFGPSSIIESTNAPALYFDLPFGSANIAVEVFINTPDHSVSAVTPLWIQVDNAEPIIFTSGAYYYFEQNNLTAGVNHRVKVSCKINRKISITIKVKKIGGFGSMFKNAKAWGKIGQGSEMILQVYNTNQFSRGKILFADALKNIIPFLSNDIYSFDLYNNKTNLSSFYGGGQINAKATILTGETSIGYIEIKDFYDDFSSRSNIINFSPYLNDSPIPIKLFSPPPLVWTENNKSEVVRNYEISGEDTINNPRINYFVNNYIALVGRSLKNIVSENRLEFTSSPPPEKLEFTSFSGSAVVGEVENGESVYNLIAGATYSNTAGVSFQVETAIISLADPPVLPTGSLMEVFIGDNLVDTITATSESSQLVLNFSPPNSASGNFTVVVKNPNDGLHAVMSTLKIKDLNNIDAVAKFKNASLRAWTFGPDDAANPPIGLAMTLQSNTIEENGYVGIARFTEATTNVVRTAPDYAWIFDSDYVQSDVASASLYNSGSDYAVSAFGLPRGSPASVVFDSTGSFIIPENSSVNVTASYDGTIVTSRARKYPRNLFVTSLGAPAIFYVLPNFVVAPPPPPPPPSPPAPTPAPAPAEIFNYLNVNGGANISETFGTGFYVGGSSVPVDMTPAADYQFVQWSGNVQFLQQPKTVKSNTVLMPLSQDVVITPEVIPRCLEYEVAPTDFLETFEIEYDDCDGNPQSIISTTAVSFCTRDFSSIVDMFGEPGSSATTIANITGPSGECPSEFFESRGTTAYFDDANNELIYTVDIWNQLINAVNSSSLPENVKQDALSVIAYLIDAANNESNFNTFLNYEINSASGVLSVFFEPDLGDGLQYIISAQISASI